MPKLALDEGCVKALRFRNAAYDIRDSKLGEFGICVLPSGRKHFYIHFYCRGERTWKIVSDAGTQDLRWELSRAAAILPSIRRSEDTHPEPGGTLFLGCTGNGSRTLLTGQGV